MCINSKTAVDSPWLNIIIFCLCKLDCKHSLTMMILTDKQVIGNEKAGDEYGACFA